MERTIKPGNNSSPVGEEFANKINTKLQVLSELVGRADLSLKLGLTYNGKRSIYDALGYLQTITPTDYILKYKRHDLSRAVIDKPVEKTWKGSVEILEADDEKETKLEKAWIDLMKTLRLKDVFIRVDKLTGLNEYGVLLLGFDDTVEIETYSLPVKKGAKLIYVKPYGSSVAQINTFDTDPKSVRFGKPSLYNININEENFSRSLIVHYSRVIHIIDNQLEYEIKGSPRLEPVYNRMDDLEKLLGGSAEMFWRGARPGHQAVIDKDYSMSPTEKSNLETSIDEYEHNLRRIITAEGFELKGIQSQVSDPTNHINGQVQMVAAAMNIPQRILIGSERGELSSSQDADEWLAYIVSRRERFAELQILRPFIDKMIEVGVLPLPTVDYSIKWQDLLSQSDKDKVEISKGLTTALKDYVSAAGAQDIIPPEAFLEVFLKLTDDQITYIQQSKEQWLKEEKKRIEEEEADEEEGKLTEEDLIIPEKEEPEEIEE